jgi:large subunit ribosomal protein L22
MEYQATAKYVRISPRKARLVADSIRKVTPEKALLKLSLTPKAGAEPIVKVLLSAIANAQTKNVEIGNLRFKKIEIMGGPVLKRWQAVSRGSAHAFKKRMTHIQIVLSDDAAKPETTAADGGKQ